MAKRKPQMIYLVEQVNGSYCETVYIPVAAFKKLKDAEAERDRLQEEADEIFERYGVSIGHIDDIMLKIFMEYLKETNSELYKKVADSESPYDYNSDEYQDAFIDFGASNKPDEYVDKAGLSEFEKESYENVKLVEDKYLFFEKPYFRVLPDPIELR